LTKQVGVEKLIVNLINWLEKEMKDLKYTLSDRPFSADVVSGGAAGFFSGGIIAPVEYSKVLLQTVPRSQWSNILHNPTTYKNMLKSVMPFSVFFGTVCAVEFSINKRIGDQCGEVAGIGASAITGTIGLTASDHLMFRRQRGQSTTAALKQLCKYKVTALWTGFTPMLGREAIFITSVMHLGPWVGNKLQGEKKEKSIFWSSVGRTITGVGTTLISQPFDVLARDMQLRLYSSPSITPRFSDSVREMHAETKSVIRQGEYTKTPLFRGSLPRMGLAVVGGVLAGGIYDHFRHNLIGDNEPAKSAVNDTQPSKIKNKMN
jgi:hypothetical protein